MVISHLDVVGITVFPSKADSVLIVDPDAELPLPVTLQLLQPVAGRGPQITQFNGGLEARPPLTALASPSTCRVAISTQFMDGAPSIGPVAEVPACTCPQ